MSQSSLAHRLSRFGWALLPLLVYVSVSCREATGGSHAGAPETAFPSTLASTSPPTTTTAAEVKLPAQLAWAPPVVIAGQSVPISLVLPDSPADATVTVDVDGSTTTALFDTARLLWKATVQIPSSAAAGGVANLIVHERRTGQAERVAEPLTVRASASTSVLVPTDASVTPLPVATLPWGSGDGQAGLQPSDGDAESMQPTALAIDSRNNHLVLLDSVNRRVLIVAEGQVSRSIPLPDIGGFLTDLVVNGDLGSATITQFSLGARTTSAFVVGLDSGQVTVLGPANLPPNTPVSEPGVWNSSDRTVYVVVNNSYYPYVDVGHMALLVGKSPSAWFETSVSDSNIVTIGSGTSRVMVQFQHSSGGLSDVTIADDGCIWFIKSIIDSAAPPESAVVAYLVRVNPVTHMAMSAVIPPRATALVIKQVAVQGRTAYLMSGTRTGLAIDEYTFPTG